MKTRSSIENTAPIVVKFDVHAHSSTDFVASEWVSVVHSAMNVQTEGRGRATSTHGSGGDRTPSRSRWGVFSMHKALRTAARPTNSTSERRSDHGLSSRLPDRARRRAARRLQQHAYGRPVERD